MYSISNKLRRKMYEGGLIMTPQVYFGSTLINNSNIKSLKLSSPIIDKNSQTMYAGSFVSRQLELEFRNLQDVDLTEKITYNIHIEEEEIYNPESIVNIGLRAIYSDSDNARHVTEAGNNRYALLYYACEPDTTYHITYTLPSSMTGLHLNIGCFSTTQEYPIIGSTLEDFVNMNYTMSSTTSSRDYTTNGNATYLVLQLYLENASYELTSYMDDILANVSVVSTPETATVPMGVYNIDSSPEDYYKKSKIVALDNGVLFKQNINIKTLFDDGEEEITARDLLTRLCEHFGVELGSYPAVNLTAKTGSYDNTISGKQYISYIAEIMGGNARIDRYGRLTIVPLKNPTTVTIDALKSKSFTFGEEYRIEEVLFDTGVWAYNKQIDGDVTGNTLVLRADNPFIYNGDDLYRRTVIDNIYNEVVGLDIYSITTENFIDITLDPEDIVTYTLGENSYSTYYDNTYDFGHTGKVATTIPTKQVERTTNVISGDERSDVRQLRTIIDQINNTLTQQATRIQTLDTNMTTADQEILGKFTGLATTAQLESLETSVTRQLSDTYSKTQIDAIIRGTDENGNVVEYVKSGSATFDINGLTIDDSDTKVKSNYSANGLNVIDKTDNSSLLYAGFDESTQETVVRSKNLRVEKYFEMGTYSRFEDYVDDNGNAGTGCFWVGD